ncbi:hypothetical protein ACJ72_02228 [Emergomyces africanus]|uniref:Uncharacterized protein n=1 Tax=Emergomyces africanus TaxID=1955775 RepID=A0A1B7P344_9EURO|nr:hypothetical protein ACJ72_02228 [Emergomyces africanus]
MSGGIGDSWNTARRAQQQATQNNPLQSSGRVPENLSGMQGSQGIGRSDLPSSDTYGTQPTQGYGAGEPQYGQPTMGRSTQPMSSQMGEGQGIGTQGMRNQGMGNQGVGGTQGMGSEGLGSEDWQGHPGQGPGAKRASQSSEASDTSSASHESHGDKSGGGGLLQKAKDKLSGVR